jgi:hypothetical protein
LPTYPQQTQKQQQEAAWFEGQRQAGSHLNFGDPWSQVWGPLQSWLQVAAPQEDKRLRNNANFLRCEIWVISLWAYINIVLQFVVLHPGSTPREQSIPCVA